jgi:hypothetical protein
MPQESKTKLKLNGLSIEIVDSKQVFINDKMSNCSETEAEKICMYLLQEGFLNKDRHISCEIVQY